MEQKEAKNWLQLLIPVLLIIYGIVYNLLNPNKSIEFPIFIIAFGLICLFLEYFERFEILNFVKATTKNIDETKSDKPNIKATVIYKETEILIYLTILHTEEHNLNFGIRFNREIGLDKLPEIGYDNTYLTQKDVKLWLPYEFNEYRQQKYIPVRISNPTSIPINEKLGIGIKRDKYPELEVISIIQLQPNGNHIEIYKKEV